MAGDKSENPGDMGRRVTIRDVAADADAAISSVSRVLSGHPHVSEKMKIRVHKAAEKLGYEPNLNAQALRSGVSRTIGFLVRDINNPLFTLIAQSCERELRRNGYSMILVNSDGSIENENQNFSLLRKRRVDGIIASLVAEDSPYLKKNLRSAHCPIILLDREVSDINISAVVANHATGVYEAVMSLAKSGHCEIALITGSNNIYPTRNRLQGFTKALKDANLPIHPDLLAIGGFDADYALSHALSLLHRKSPPTAFLAGGIGALMGISQAFKQCNLTMGIDVAFIALDTLSYLEIFSANISTVYRDPMEMGREAALLLLDGLDGAESRISMIETQFIARESSQGGI
ncbi:LacI family transcriptional regulator [Actinomycetes bacterium]|nr:LacI family transcriptional regulator [Actinomycetes bacterium]